MIVFDQMFKALAPELTMSVAQTMRMTNWEQSCKLGAGHCKAQKPHLRQKVESGSVY